MIGDNAPPPADWSPTCHCGGCKACDPPLTIPSNITLGSE